jgi:hypothetical protein
MASAGPRKDCPHCKAGSETFRYLRRKFVFDVDRARTIVSDGREPVELDPADVQRSVDDTRIYEEHVAHVNVAYPGIVAHLWFPTEDGQVVHAHRLIDGHHRAARCLQLGRPFLVHVLTEAESKRIMVAAPKLPRKRRQVAVAK